ncbi:MAG: hypothetical protein ACM3MG_03685 [Bacillota bacterium]
MRLLNFTLLLSCACSQAFAAIQSASNISGDKVVISVHDDKSPGRVLVRLNLKTATKEAVSLPQDLGGEEIMGMVLLSDHLVMISQWTAGDGKNPHVFEYSFKDKTWNKPTEVSCLSFDTVEVKSSELKIQCEENGEKKASLSFKADSPVKLVFPLQGDKQGALQYKLSGGSMFMWKSIDFQDANKPKKSLTTADLLK